MKKLLLTAVLAVSLIAASGTSASQATLTVSPANPVIRPGGTPPFLTFAGCGWVPTNFKNVVYLFILAPDGSHELVATPVDQSGCFTTDGTYRSSLGAYEVTASQKGGGKPQQVILDFAVVLG